MGSYNSFVQGLRTLVTRSDRSSKCVENFKQQSLTNRSTDPVIVIIIIEY